MKFDGSVVTRILLTSVFAVVCFGGGFLYANRSDGTPGGFGHGLVVIQGATPISGGGGWPCGPSDSKCNFAFHFEGSEDAQPTDVACEHKQACLTFSGTKYLYEMHNGTYQYGEKPVTINGALEFYK
jgi:hypothetical protein